MPEHWSLVGLFFSAFVSSTLFPGGSELVLAALNHYTEHSLWLLLAVASAGNTLGGMTSWAIGWLLARRFPARRYLTGRRATAVEHVRRWGAPVLILSWVPVVGDPLCVAAGWLRIGGFVALSWIALGKVLRYLVVLLLTQSA
jgi:membrane protein YqaA with SNARE-associated domain